MNGWPPLNATSAELRSKAVSITSLVDRRRAENDPFGVRIEEIRDDGMVAIANGQCFDLGKTANTADLLHRQPDPALLPMLVVPYETTPVSIVFGAEPWLFILKSDDRGRLVDILILTLVEDERRRWPFVVAKALISVHRLDDGEPAPIIHVDADHREQRQIQGYLWLTWTLLAIINDRRLALQRETTPAKLTAARLKRGKPALPDLWRLDIADAAYTTTLASHDPARAGRRGGHHKSPIAHSRRAHFRTAAVGQGGVRARLPRQRGAPASAPSRSLRPRRARQTTQAARHGPPRNDIHERPRAQERFHQQKWRRQMTDNHNPSPWAAIKLLAEVDALRRAGPATYGPDCNADDIMIALSGTVGARLQLRRAPPGHVAVEGLETAVALTIALHGGEHCGSISDSEDRQTVAARPLGLRLEAYGDKASNDLIDTLIALGRRLDRLPLPAIAIRGEHRGHSTTTNERNWGASH